MGLLAKGLVGLLFGGSGNNGKGGYGSYPSGGHSAPIWECRYCGRKNGSFARPSANKFGKCKNSPYGTHYWEQI